MVSIVNYLFEEGLTRSQHYRNVAASALITGALAGGLGATYNKIRYGDAFDGIIDVPLTAAASAGLTGAMNLPYTKPEKSKEKITEKAH